MSTDINIKKKKSIVATVATVPLEQTKVAIFVDWRFLPIDFNL